MTAAIHRFPATDDTFARITERAKAENIAAERAEAVRIARAMMVSPSYYSDDEMRDACVALQAWGDATDYCTADAMIFAINKREWQARNCPRPEPETGISEHAKQMAALILGGLLAVALATGWL